MSTENIPALTSLVGRWSGQSRLWLAPGDPVHLCDTTLTVSLAAQGQFTLLAYSWAFEGAPQDGLILVQAAQAPVPAIWIDSWHMQNNVMVCQLSTNDQGQAVLLGGYAAPPGPDWGWQIAIALQTDDRLQIIMHNITPDGQAFLAVQADYARQA